MAKTYDKKEKADLTVRELDSIMKQCGCRKIEGGRGSGIGYVHIKMVIRFLKEVGEL